MEASILNSTKKVLGLDAEYTAFDLDILTHINASMSVLDQLGLGPSGGFYIEDSEQTWDELNLPNSLLSMVRSYIFLKVRMLFDPPGTSFLIEAMEKQIAEFEWRMTNQRDLLLAPSIVVEVPIEEVNL